MKRILKSVLVTGKDKLDRRKGCFELIGCDFMIDDNFTPYLIELNTNPAITIGTKFNITL